MLAIVDDKHYNVSASRLERSEGVLLSSDCGSEFLVFGNLEDAVMEGILRSSPSEAPGCVEPWSELLSFEELIKHVVSDEPSSKLREKIAESIDLPYVFSAGGYDHPAELSLSGLAGFLFEFGFVPRLCYYANI